MKQTPKITPAFKTLQRLHAKYEEARKDLTREIMQLAKDLPMSESEICRRVEMSRSAWAGYKETGLPFDRFAKIIEFFAGLRIDNKPVIL